MSTDVRLPSPYHVRTLLGDLLSRPVEVSPGPPWAPINGEPGTVALYMDDAYVVRALGVCDLRFSAYASAALGLVPRAAAQRAVTDRRIDKNLEENLAEVLDICASLYNVEGATHLRLYRVCHIGTEVSPHTRALSAALGRRLDLTVNIAGYGGGRFAAVGVL